MEPNDKDKFEICIDALAGRLPERVGNFVRWIVGRSSALVRIPLGIALIAGGIVGFLPFLGFWMVPLGLVLIASNIPFLRPPLIGLLSWINRKLPERRESS